MDYYKYYSELKEITREPDSVLENFFKVVSSKNIENITQMGLNECIEQIGHHHLCRFLALQSIING